MAENSVLRDLTTEQKQKAFDKTYEHFKEPGVKLILVTEEYYDTALNFAKDYYITEEPVNKSLGMQWTQEVKELWKNCFKHNLSLMFLNKENGEPIAIRTTKITRYNDKTNIETIQDGPLKLLLQFLEACDKKADFFGHFPTQEAFHFFGLCVAPKYKHRGYAKKIFYTAVDLIRNFGFDTVYMKVEGNSNYSKRIFEQAGCEELFEQPYDTWEIDGNIPIQNTGEHKSMKVYGMKISNN